MNFRLEPDDRAMEFRPDVVIIATHTGRNQKTVTEHIRELEERGVRPPMSVPRYLVMPSAVLSQSTVQETPSPHTSGEAEFALLIDTDASYVTIASDHTDRAAQQLDVQLSKQTCVKVIGRSAWRLDDVAERWDRLVLRSWTGDALDLYQEGALAALLSPSTLLAMLPWRKRAARFVVLGGTLPAMGGIRTATSFRAELSDPETGRALSLEYRTEILEPLALAPDRPEMQLMALLRRAERRLDQ